MTGKISKLIEDLAEYGEACLWYSGGKDSRLILEALICGGIPFQMLRFDEMWTPEQKKKADQVVLDQGLLVYSYSPALSMMVGDGENLAMAMAYRIGKENHVALYRDIVPGDRCAFDVKLREDPQGTIIAFPKHIVGTKGGESHFIMEGKPFITEPKWAEGEMEFFAPLIEWTDQEVYDALFEFGVELAPEDDAINTGNVPCCHNCLTAEERVFCPKEGIEIDAVKWSPRENLARWREVVLNA